MNDEDIALSVMSELAFTPIQNLAFNVIRGNMPRTTTIYDIIQRKNAYQPGLFYEWRDIDLAMNFLHDHRYIRCGWKSEAEARRWAGQWFQFEPLIGLPSSALIGCHICRSTP